MVHIFTNDTEDADKTLMPIVGGELSTKIIRFLEKQSRNW